MQTTIINDITDLEFVSDKGLWSPKLSGNDMFTRYTQK